MKFFDSLTRVRPNIARHVSNSRGNFLTLSVYPITLYLLRQWTDKQQMNEPHRERQISQSVSECVSPGELVPARRFAIDKPDNVLRYSSWNESSSTKCGKLAQAQ